MPNAYLAPMYRALIANRDRIDRFDDHGLWREHADPAREPQGGKSAWGHVSRQIAVRLSDDLVEFVDSIVETGEQRSSAAVVTRALERERSRRIAARDAEILAASDPDADLASLAEHASDAPVDLE